MISSLTGRVLDTQPGRIVVGVAGVGLTVLVAEGAQQRVHPGDEISLHTKLVVREDALTLYGFKTLRQLEVFEMLLGVNGIGPKVALGVLGTLTFTDIAAAVQSEDYRAFVRVPGIGPKTAKLITVSLAGKLAHLLAGIDSAAAPAKETGSNRVAAEVIAALTGLGWSEREAKTAVQAALETDVPVERAALLKNAISQLRESSGTSR